MKSIRRNAAAAACCLILVTACGGGGGGEDSAASSPTVASQSDSAPVGEARQGGELTVGLPYAWESLDPLQFNFIQTLSVARSVYDPLIDLGPEGELVPSLVSEWSSPDDGKTWVFTLLEGVQFHDGTEFNAEAVKAHLDRLRDPENACACSAQVADIESVEATAANELTITLNRQLAWFPSIFVTEVGMVPSPTAVEQLGDQYGLQPVGTGPFKFVQQQAGDTINFERNENYWQDGLPLLDAITYRVIADPATRFASLQAGDVDIITEPPTNQWATADSDPELEIVPVGSLGAQFILLNATKPPFDDINARLAVSYAIDAVTFTEVVNHGTTSPLTSIFHEGSWAYPGEIEEYPSYDLDAAKALVAELGGLKFELATTQVRMPAAQAIQAMLIEAGMEVELVPMETAALVAANRNYELQATFTQNVGRPDPAIFAQRFKSDSPTNLTGVKDAQLDEYIQAAEETTDEAVRAEQYALFAHRAAELVPLVYLNNLNIAHAIRSEVTGILEIPDGVLRPATIGVDS